MKYASSFRLLLALTVGVCVVAGCDLGPTVSRAKKTATKMAQAFLEEAGGSAKEQVGRSIVRDSVAVLQADLETDLGSSLADDASFGTSGASGYRVQETVGGTNSSAAPTLEQLKAHLAEVNAKIEAIKKDAPMASAGPVLTDAQKAALAELERVKKDLETAIANREKAAGDDSNTGSGDSNTTTGSGSNTGTDGDSNTTTGSGSNTGTDGDSNTTTGSGSNTGTDGASNTTTGSGSNSGSAGSGTATSGSTTAPSPIDLLRKKLAEIMAAGAPLVERANNGHKLTEDEARRLEGLKKEYAAIAVQLEAALKQQAAGSSNGGTTSATKPPERKPEPPKVDATRKVEAPAEHAKPEDHLKAAPGANTHAESGSADVSELKKRLEELQKANEMLRKQQEELRAKTEELRKKIEEIAKKREQAEKKAKEVAKNVQKSVTDNGDGTLTYHMKLEAETAGARTTHEVSKTVNALTKELVEEASLITKVFNKDGTTVKIGRTRKQNEDGSWSATFSSEITRGGKTKTVDWNRTHHADGSGTAEGKIVRADGSTVQISIVRDADGTTHATATDTKHKVKAEVEKDSDVDTTATAKITDTEKNETIAEVEIDDTSKISPVAD